MIDWLTFVVPLSCSAGLNTGQVASITPDGSIEWTCAKRVPLVGSYDQRMFLRPVEVDLLDVSKRGVPGSLGGAREFARAAVLSRSLVEISGCPAKFLQGHNVFGSDDICGLAAAVVRRACDLLGLSASPVEMRSIERGAFLLRRVDLTESYVLPSRSDVLAWIKAAERVGRLGTRKDRSVGQFARVRGRGLFDESTLNFGQGSQYWWLKFYAKGVELEAAKHRLPESLVLREQLLEYAQPLLRCEVQLNSKQLARLGLRYGSSWSAVSAADVWREHVEQVNMTGDSAVPDSTLEALPKRLRPVFLAWKSGADLSSIYPRTTLFRYRKELLNFAVDISTPYMAPGELPRSNVVPLRRVLEAVPVVGPPAWAVGTPLYFDPLAELARRAKR